MNLDMHSSICCFYVLVCLAGRQAVLTCFGNTTVAYAAYLLARSNGWTWARGVEDLPAWLPLPDFLTQGAAATEQTTRLSSLESAQTTADTKGTVGATLNGDGSREEARSEGLVGFEDLGETWSADSDAAFFGKLLAGCLALSYLVKYLGMYIQPPTELLPAVALALVFVPSLLNALKWQRRSQDGAAF
eukprot:4922669-Pleurochrysis_carterae.AAC.1